MTIKITFSDTCNDTTSPLLVMDQGEWIPEEAYAAFDAGAAELELTITRGTGSLLKAVWDNRNMVLINIPPYSSRTGLEALAANERLKDMLLAAYYSAKSGIPCSPVWEPIVSSYLSEIVAQDETYM